MKTRYILIFIFVVLGIANLQAQTASQNYIQTRTYTKEDGTTYLDAIQYFDGLGRPVQVVQKAVTQLKADLVTYQEYDSFGREERSWLPVVAAGNNGAYMPLATYKTKAMTTYNSTTYNTMADSVAYSRPVYEASPLNRVLEQYGTGVDWKNNKKAVRTGYLTNIAKSATTWVDADSLVCGLYKTTDATGTISLFRAANYGAGELYVTRLKDESENVSYEFKDKQGQVVLTRQINAGKLHDTNYIYDSFGNLRAVLPPEASDRLLSSSSWTETDTNLKLYAYLYKYDDRNRCIAKKLPGCEWIYYVYDKADRVIYTQDGEQRSKGQWLFSIPDVFGRVVLTGICKDTISVSNKVVKGVYASAGSYKAYNIQVDGVTKTFTNAPSILLANYYDNYEFMNQGPSNYAYLIYTERDDYGKRYGTDQEPWKSKGLLTGTVTLLEGAGLDNTYLYSTMYYDYRSRLIQTKYTHHLNGIASEYFAYNFTGQPLKHWLMIDVPNKERQTEVYTYTYDHAGRLLKTTHQLNGAAAVTLADNTYDELGRLKYNQKGGLASSKTTYGYNIRSWTKSITSPMFNQTLYYNESYGGSKAQYNGNISAMSWDQSDGSSVQGYAFSYDNLSRLTIANSLVNENPHDGHKMPQITYDKHGNITKLQLWGKKDAGTTYLTYAMVDDLTMTYSGNQLVRVNDAVANIDYAPSMDFKNYSNVATEYTYNANGAMNKDLNKGITEIQYNSLNLPRQMDIKSPVAEARNEYTYSAGGQKLKVVQKWNPNYSTTPVIGSAINTTALTQSKTTDYVGNKIYENGTLKRILINGGYIEGGVYYYYLTDHLGNNRVVVNASGTLIQRNHYYPFGSVFAGTTTDEQPQPYKYNGKELDQMHGLNLYDYSARYYESAVGRFTSVDPLAELHYDNSPYAYVLNNPIKYIDPFGMDTIYAYKDGTEFDRVKAPGDHVTIYGPSGDAVVEGQTSPVQSYYSNILSGMAAGATSAGAVNSYRQYTQYNQALNIWRGQNGKIYQGLKGKGPNGYTGSRALAKAKANRIGYASNVLTALGIFITYKQYKYDMAQNPGPNLKHHLQTQHIQDQLFNFSGFFGLYGAALSFGYNSGYLIEGMTGQNIQFNPYTNDFTPIEETLTEFDNLGFDMY